MTMVKQVIQPRRRKQKTTNGNPPTKPKQTKISNKIETKQEDYMPRQENYPTYGDIYPPHVHLVHHHPFDQHQRYTSQQQHLELTVNGFDAELCARTIITSPRNTDEQQHLNVIKNVHSN